MHTIGRPVLRFLAGAACVWIYLSSPGWALESLSSKSSDQYPVEAYSTSAVAIEEAITIANQCIYIYKQVFQVDFPQDFKLVYQWNIKQDEGDVDAFNRSVILNFHGPMEFDIQLSGTPGTQQESIARTTFIVLLQMASCKKDPLKAGEKLGEPPLWLIEGLTQKYMVTYQEDSVDLLDQFQKIILRYAENKRYPSLEVIQAWKDLSPQFLERKWQQVFCWRLLEATSKSAQDQMSMKSWLMDKKAYSSNLFAESPQKKSWWEAQIKIPVRVELPLLDYATSATEIRNVLRFSAVLRGSEAVQHLSIQDLPSDPDLMISDEVHRNQLRKLEILRSQINFAWQDVMAAYSKAFIQWENKKYKEYRELIALAQDLYADRVRLIGKVGDRLDWYEINFPSNSSIMDIRPYQKIFEADAGQKSLVKEIIKKQTEIK